MQPLLYFALFFLLSSCVTVKAPEVKQMSNVKGVEQNEGETALLLEWIVVNPNKIQLKILEGNADVYIEEKKAGKAYFKDKITLKKNAENKIETKVFIQPEEGLLLSLLPMAFKKTIEVEFRGEIKGRAMGITKKDTFEFRQSVNPKALLKQIRNYFQN